MCVLRDNPEIKSKIDELWNRFWSGGISNPLTAIEQITYLLFMKNLDENDRKKKQQMGKKYESKFEGVFDLSGNGQNTIEKEKLRWSALRAMVIASEQKEEKGKEKKISSEDILTHVQRWVFPFLKQLDEADSPFVRHMRKAVFLIPKPSLLRDAIKIIDEIFELMAKEREADREGFQDIQGDVYEYLLSEIATAGKNGQFRTPRHIIKLMVEMVAPQFGQKIADPACGTGGFLLGAYQYMIAQLDKGKTKSRVDRDGFIRSKDSSFLTRKEQKVLNQSLRGYDIDSTMVRLGLMNLMMHGIDSPQVDYADTLGKEYEEKAVYDVVLANPPFKGNIDKGDVHKELTINTRKSELLFIERIHQILKDGGTAGVIVPQGVLFGASKAHVATRKLLIDKAELKAVVSMPSGVFKPYAGVSTALLIFKKGSTTKQVWFYDMRDDGRTLDDKRTKLEGYGDLQDIITQYKVGHSQGDRKGKCFSVPKSEIIEENYDLSFSRYKEMVFEEIVYDKPAVILEKLTVLEEKINVRLTALKELF